MSTLLECFRTLVPTSSKIQSINFILKKVNQPKHLHRTMKSPQSNQDENTITSILYDPTSDCVPRRLSRSHSQITAVMHRRYRPYAVVWKRKWLHPKCTVHGRRRSRHAISPSSIIQVVGKKLRSF